MIAVARGRRIHPSLLSLKYIDNKDSLVYEQAEAWVPILDKLGRCKAVYETLH